MKEKNFDMIVVRGARQNNLKNLNLDIPIGELIVVTGVSGSGKSSLVFDTLYAEGQRRYVETFSPYARQFLDRMDKPAVDRIEGIPPSIAIDQTNPVRTSRSTVGTMTELNDHLRLLFARAAHLHCHTCGVEVKRNTIQTIGDDLYIRSSALGNPRLLITFTIDIPKNFKEAEVTKLLNQQGYKHIRQRNKTSLEVVQDRIKLSQIERSRVMESLEVSMRLGQGRLQVHALEDPHLILDSSNITTAKAMHTWRYSSGLHCATCNISYREPTQSGFSFNSPAGACPICKGFGRIIGVDYGLVIPDHKKTLREGAIRVWQTDSYVECQKDLERWARKQGVPLDIPWCELSEAHRKWVIEGEGKWSKKVWYGLKNFFAWLEKKSYKMHIRVLLSRYRSYTQCETCDGARLTLQSLLWRLGDFRLAEEILGIRSRFILQGTHWSSSTLNTLPGLCIHDLMLLPLERSRDFFAQLKISGSLDKATELLLTEVRSRYNYLCEVGLGYLTLDRQSRTLSGGEVQRINLTTALGTSLVNTLFVLDEPSIGLHPRDMQKIIQVMHRLRDAGNSLLVVEHDSQIMLESDKILDMGPGAGEHGGHIVSYGTPTLVCADSDSITGAYLSGRRQVHLPPRSQRVTLNKPGVIELIGVSQNNLRNINVRFPLGQLVCITGVSGSGKSTLIQSVLYPALLKQKGRPSEVAGTHQALKGAELISDVIFVDQNTIGRTTRSNAASYVGAFDLIRNCFAKLQESRERTYTPGTFSFNAGTGRCPACRGNGFEHVEMQFLSDVYLRCEQCNGSRYRNEILEILHPGPNGSNASIADVLAMTVTEALIFFSGMPDLAARLKPLADVGLDYLRLGQPVPTLSGGEAQRLKLARHLIESSTPTKIGKLFLFDEPTTGLHFEDIAKLLNCFCQLLDAGHSLIIIEHNLDVIRTAEWIIDLGPEGGDAGGQLLTCGTPEKIMKILSSHTGRALTNYQPKVVFKPTLSKKINLPEKSIFVKNAREHNLKNINVEIPRNALTVITGISGSGKSTLAFDILFKEGQRRYLESLNAYARQFVQPSSRPEVDAIYGIPPTVAIEQRTSRGGYKSTVSTLTEIYHFLRLMYSKLGTQYCPDCQLTIEPQSPEEILAKIFKDYSGKTIELLAPLIISRKGLYTDLAKWAASKGFKELRVDGELLAVKPWPRLDRYKEHNIELPMLRISISLRSQTAIHAKLLEALQYGKGVVQVLPNGSKNSVVFSTKRACPSCGIGFTELDPRLFSFNSKQGWCENCFGMGIELENFNEDQTGEENTWLVGKKSQEKPCGVCVGSRLNRISRAVLFRDKSISELTCATVKETNKIFSELKLNHRESNIARDLVGEIITRLNFLERVGLGYLALNRAAPTLSGGEAQRIRLASQLGSNLRGVCYVLDEPTIGLHPRDNNILLVALSELAANNTLVVVEHDEETIRRANHVIDLGPGAGVGGGFVVGSGRIDDLITNSNSITGLYLRAPLIHPAQPRRPVNKASAALVIERATLHNLKELTVRIPLARFCVITGVSGSGKSTLARNVLYPSSHALLSDPTGNTIGCSALKGMEQVSRVLEVDQTPIGKTPRSCPATYVGIWDEIRHIYASTTEARLRGYKSGRFSFNTAGGRCEACEGQGTQTIEMSFLPDVKITCDICHASRFNAETLSITYREKTIGEVLSMSIEKAVEFFKAHATIHHVLTLLCDVGLGYLTLGQQSPTLSGGEAQRIKLIAELAKYRVDIRAPIHAKVKNTLYILDEPTVGLHMADVNKLLHVLHRLVDAGNTVVLVEHNLDIMAQADWIIDLGPEAGSAGGKLVAQCSPQRLAAKPGNSHTGLALKNFLVGRVAGV